MKHSLKSRYHILMICLLALLLLESLLLLISLNRAHSLPLLVKDLQTIIIVFVFILFIYIVVIFNYIPYRMKKSYQDIAAIIEDISHGNYAIEINEEKFVHDPEQFKLVHSITKMLNIVQRFDAAKAEKIYEHHQRLQQLINLLPQWVIIATVNGDVAYCNDSIRRKYNNITEMVNLNELIFKNSFDDKIFSSINEALRFGNNLYDVNVADPVTAEAAFINGSIIRNQKGLSTGGVFVISSISNAK